MTQEGRRFLRLLWWSLLLPALALLGACDDGEDGRLVLSREDVYTVRYSLEGAETASCFCQYYNESGRLEPAGRVELPWAEEATLGGGRRARLRAWGNHGSQPIRLTITVNGLPIVSRTLSPGGNLVELSFALP